MDILSIKDDAFLKNMNNKELNELTSDIRSFLLENISRTGGHLSSNIGNVELTIALHKCFDLTKDTLIFDVGHQGYTHMILNGKAKDFVSNDNTRHFDPFVSGTDGISFGHSSTSISTAMGIAISQSDNKNIIVYIGDASICSGVAFEALNNLSLLNKKIIVVLNDNNMSISRSTGAMAKALSHIRSSKGYYGFRSFIEKTFGPKFVNFCHRFVHRISLVFRSDNIFDNFEIDYLGPINGHNFKALEKAFNSAKKYPRSILVHIRTRKGKGYLFSENDMIGKYHSIAPFNLQDGTIYENNISYNETLSNVLEEELKASKNTYLICSAMVYGSCFNNLFNTYKSQCFDVGINEEHAVSFANGMTYNDSLPFVSFYSTFAQRGYDEIVNDVILKNNKIIFLLDHCGINSYFSKSHQGIYDVNMFASFKNALIAFPSSVGQYKSIINLLKTYNGPSFVRIPSEYDNKLSSIQDINSFDALLLNYNVENKYTLLVTGPLFEILYKEFKNEKINFINPIFLNPIDFKTIDKVINTDFIIIDRYAIYDGFTSKIASYLNKYSAKHYDFNLDESKIDSLPSSTILKNMGLDNESLINKIKEIINGSN